MDVLEIKYLLVEEVADVLRIARSTAYMMAKRGDFPVVRLGRVVRVPEREFGEWLKGQTQLAGHGNGQGQNS